MDNIDNFEELKEYLDRCITHWRKERIEAEYSGEDEYELVCRCYIDAFQSVRYSVFGILLEPLVKMEEK